MLKSKFIHLEDMDLKSTIEKIDKLAEKDDNKEYGLSFKYGALQASYEMLYNYVTTGELRACSPDKISL